MSWGETIFLKNSIDGKKTFRASDNILLNYIDERTDLYENDITLGTFIAKTSGQIKMKAFATPNDISSICCKIAIYNGITELAILSWDSTSTDNPTERSGIINVEKNKTYTIKTYTVYPYPANKLTCYSLDICADIVDGSLFDYTVGE